MEFVFPALERRFDRDGQLKKLGRRLYQGKAEKARTPRNYVEVLATNTHNDFDTFDSTEPVYSLTFRVVSKSSAPKCSSIMRHIKRVFSTADLQSGHFSTSSMRTTGDTGPEMVDNLYEGEVTFDLHIVLNSELPLEKMTV